MATRASPRAGGALAARTCTWWRERGITAGIGTSPSTSRRESRRHSFGMTLQPVEGVPRRQGHAAGVGEARLLDLALGPGAGRPRAPPAPYRRAMGEPGRPARRSAPAAAGSATSSSSRSLPRHTRSCCGAAIAAGSAPWPAALRVDALALAGGATRAAAQQRQRQPPQAGHRAPRQAQPGAQHRGPAAARCTPSGSARRCWRHCALTSAKCSSRCLR